MVTFDTNVLIYACDARDSARQAVADFVSQYNTKRLHSAIGCVTPKDKLEGRTEAIHEERDRKLAAARQRRKQRRQARRL